MRRLIKNRSRSNESGTALVTAIFAILLGTLIAVALYHYTMTMMTVSINNRDATEALYLADAGVNHASKLIGKLNKEQYSSVLTNGSDPVPDTGDELSVPLAGGEWTTAESIPVGTNASGGVMLGAGRYFISVRNDTATDETATVDKNGILIIRATGIGRDGAVSTIEATIKSGAGGTPYPGFLADGLVKISNVTRIIGPNAIMQVNDILDTSSNLCSENKIQILSGDTPNMSNITTGPACDQPGVIGSTVLLNQPRIPPPIIDIPKLRSDFRSKADFVFKTGAIYRQTNGVQEALPLSDVEKTSLGFDAWSWSGSKWSYSSATAMINGVYYFENCDMKISNGGDPVSPPKITFFNEGSIEITNGPAFQPKLPGFAMVSANDIRVSSKIGVVGNPGLVYAYGQVEFTNQTAIVGGVIVANFYQADGTNGPDALDFEGNNQVDRASKGTVRFSNKVNIITVNGLGIESDSGAKTIDWREVRQ